MLFALFNCSSGGKFNLFDCIRVIYKINMLSFYEFVYVMAYAVQHYVTTLIVRYK